MLLCSSVDTRIKIFYCIKIACVFKIYFNFLFLFPKVRNRWGSSLRYKESFSLFGDVLENVMFKVLETLRKMAS